MNKKYFINLILFLSFPLYLFARNVELSLSNYNTNRVFCSIDFLKKVGGKWIKENSNVRVEANKQHNIAYDTLIKKVQKITWYFEDLQGRPLSDLYCIDVNKSYRTNPYDTLAGKNASFLNKPDTRQSIMRFSATYFDIEPMRSKYQAPHIIMLEHREYKDFICAPLIKNPDGSVFFDIK